MLVNLAKRAVPFCVGGVLAIFLGKATGVDVVSKSGSDTMVMLFISGLAMIVLLAQIIAEKWVERR